MTIPAEPVALVVSLAQISRLGWPERAGRPTVWAMSWDSALFAALVVTFAATILDYECECGDCSDPRDAEPEIPEGDEPWL